MLFFETTSFFMDFFNNLYSESPQSVIFRSELLNAIPTFVTGLRPNDVLAQTICKAFAHFQIWEANCILT